MIANLQAARLRGRAATTARLRQVTAGKAELVAPASLDELERDCERIGRAQPQQIIIAGGDGTAMRVLSALRRVYGTLPVPPVAILPFGTVNTSMRRVGAVGSPWDLLDQVLSGGGTVRPQPILELELDGTAYSAFTFGAGLVSHFFAEYERNTVRGTRAALAIFAKVFFGSMIGHDYALKILAPVPARLCVDGRPSALHQLTLLVSSVFANVGLGLRPTYRAATQAERVHLVATDLAARRLGPQAWRVALGKPLVAADLVDQLVGEFSVEFDRVTPVILDGDSVKCRRASVRRGTDRLVWSPR